MTLEKRHIKITVIALVAAVILLWLGPAALVVVCWFGMAGFLVYAVARLFSALIDRLER